MLTIKQPVHYGYKSVHDLPTPPSTSRPSPPLIFQESHKPLPAIPRSHSPLNQPMSGHHRGLPPPAAMALPQPPPPGPGSHPPPPPPGSGIGQVPPPSGPALQAQQLGQLPAPPQWQASEESMRAWLLAKAEEEKRRQEELRLEQRRMEHDILRTSLQGGIPPPMVPVVFAGMGGGNLPQAALEWAQQFMYSQAQQAQHPQLLPPAGPVSPHHHRRDSQSQAPYGPYPGSGGVPSTPGSAQGPQFVAGYPGSPTRPRGYSLPPGSRPLGASNLPTLNTNVHSGPGGPSGGHSHPGMASAQAERPSSPPIYFHHWQPPTSQASQGSSNQPATPSGESPRKRKATGPQQAAPPPSSHQRFRSPPFSQASGSTLSNPPPGRRRGHSRQRSDISSYRPTGHGRSEGFGGPQRGASPMPGSGPSSAREGNSGGSAAEAFSTQPQQQQQPPPSLSQTRSGAHSVSSLLSEDPSPHTPQYPRVSSSSDVRVQQAVDSDQRNSPHSSDDRTRGGAAGLVATRERDNE